MSQPQSRFDDSDPLDAGLRAAFAFRQSGSGSGSVCDVLEVTTGVRAAVILREEAPPTDELLQPVSSDLPRIPGRYELAGELARGGIGVVLKGRDVDLGRDVALKVLRAEHRGNAGLMKRLVVEAQIAGQLQHPGILPVYELGLDEARRPYFAMKLIRGESLAAILQRRASVEHDLPRLIGVFEHVCHTIAYAHARGVVHRDLKPSNVMVGAFGEVQVVDWGLAKLLTSHRRSAETTAYPEPPYSPVDPGGLSEVGAVLGTPGYMAPEQASGDVDQVDERTDVFGLGAILCEILTGHPPFEGKRLDAIELAKRGDTQLILERLASSSADAALVDLAKRCIEAAREDRPRDAGELARRVQGHREATAARARASELAAAQARAQAAAERRSRLRTLAFAAALMLSGALLGLSFLRAEQQSLRADRESFRADQAALKVERARAERLESTLGLLMPLEGKGHYLILQAAQASDKDRPQWLQALGLLREIVLKNAASAPDGETRERAMRLANELLRQEKELSQPPVRP